jgi:HAMP domain-containing protein
MSRFREESFSQHPHLRLLVVILIAEVAFVAHVLLFSEFVSAGPLC